MQSGYLRVVCARCGSPFTTPLEDPGWRCDPCMRRLAEVRDNQGEVQTPLRKRQRVSLMADTKRMSSSYLQSVLQTMRIDSSGCFERSELEALLQDGLAVRRPPTNYVVCVYGSPTSGGATQLALSIVRPQDTVHLYSACRDLEDKAEMEKAATLVEQWFQDHPRTRATVISHCEVVSEQTQGEALVEYAAAHDVGMVVLGARSDGSTVPVGHFSDYVIAQCTRPVLLATTNRRRGSTVSHPLSGTSDRSTTYMVCVKGRDSMQAVTRHVLKLMHCTDAAHVYAAPMKPFHALGTLSQEAQDEELAKRTRAAEDAVDHTTQCVMAVGKFQMDAVHAVVDEPRSTLEKAILKYSKQHNVDVIALGGSGGKKNVSAMVRHLLQHGQPAAVLIAHPTPSVEPLETISLSSWSTSLAKASAAGLEWNGRASRGLLKPYLNETGKDVCVFAAILGRVLSDPTGLCHSFIDPRTGQLDIEEVREIFTFVAATKSRVLREVVTQSIRESVEAMETLVEACPGATVRSFFILLECPLLFTPDMASTLGHLLVLLVVLVGGTATSAQHFRKEAIDFWGTYSAEDMERLVSNVQRFLTDELRRTLQVTHPSVAATVVLGLLHTANFAQATQPEKACGAGGVIPSELFYNEGVSSLVNMQAELEAWRRRQILLLHGRVLTDTQEFSFLAYPFILDPAAKARVVHATTGGQRNRQVAQAIFANLLLGGQHLELYLVVEVPRDKLLAAAVRTLTATSEFHKPLIVTFTGEMARDLGGPKNEFFQQLFQELFNEDLGLFTHRSQVAWFHPQAGHLGRQFRFVGMLLGLALYNDVVVTTNFPSCLFKSILSVPQDLADLQQIDPELAHGLRELLKYVETDGMTLEETFCRTFTVEQEVQHCVGVTHTVVELKPAGVDTPLTIDNREEYVQLYIDWVLNRSVKPVLGRLLDGFWQVCGPTKDVLQLCQPRELEMLMCGLTALDFDELKEHTTYGNGYTADTPIVQMFWEETVDFDEEQKKQFLIFCTGCDRISTQGFKALDFKIHRMCEDTEQLPTAHTCFHQLDLPEYSSRVKLRTKLLMAVMQYSTGFGFA